MTESILGMNMVLYFVIGFIYAICTVNRHQKQQDTENIEKTDKVWLFFLLAIFWVVFVIGDIIDLSKREKIVETYIIKEKDCIPIGLINDKLLQSGFSKATTVLEFPCSSSECVLEYRGDVALIHALVKYKSIPIIVSYHSALESLVYMQRHIYNISLYLLFNKSKFLGVFAISGDIYNISESVAFDFYYGDSLPLKMSDSISRAISDIL